LVFGSSRNGSFSRGSTTQHFITPERPALSGRAGVFRLLRSFFFRQFLPINNSPNTDRRTAEIPASQAKDSGINPGRPASAGFGARYNKIRLRIKNDQQSQVWPLLIIVSPQKKDGPATA